MSCNYKALNCLDKTYALKKEKELLKHHKKGWYILKLRCISQVLYEYLTELEECDIKNQTSRIWVSSFGYPLRNQNQNRFDSSWHCSQFTQINFFLPPLKKNSPQHCASSSHKQIFFLPPHIVLHHLNSISLFPSEFSLQQWPTQPLLSSLLGHFSWSF